MFFGFPIQPETFTLEDEDEMKEPNSKACKAASSSSLSDPEVNSNSEGKVRSVQAHPGHGDEEIVSLEYTEPKPLATGTFGSVTVANLLPTNEIVAIKSVVQDSRYRNRELDIMKSLQHCNVIELKYYFFENEGEDIKLNLILEFLPQTLKKLIRHYEKFKMKLHQIYVKLFMYQLLRGLNYIHSLGICHRDIKPQNVLLKYTTGVLKLCDFGSAKKLVSDEPNVSYICSRYYRAPELIFGAVNYSTKIDVWSAGCILAELIIGRPMFTANSGVEMLVEIIKVLGTPKANQIRKMNPDAGKYRLPDVKPRKLSAVFGGSVPPEAIDLLSKFLVWEPDVRISPGVACCHVFFDELRGPDTKLPTGDPLPPLFNFTDYELTIDPTLNEFLIPKWMSTGEMSSNLNSSNAGPNPS